MNLPINLSRHCGHNSKVFVQHANKNSFDHKMKSLQLLFVVLKWLKEKVTPKKR